MTGVVRWEDPPPHGNTNRDRSHWTPVAAELRLKPGVWAVIAEGVPTGTAGALTHRIKGGRHPWTPAGAFEARGVTRDGRSDLYARYVGDG